MSRKQLCKFEGKKINSDQWWNNDKCSCECKKRHVCEKYYVKNPATSSCKNRKYLASIMDDSAIICDKVRDADRDVEAKLYDKETKAVPTTFNEKNKSFKTPNLTYILINNYSIIKSY